MPCKHEDSPLWNIVFRVSGYSSVPATRKLVARKMLRLPNVGVFSPIPLTWNRRGICLVFGQPGEARHWLGFLCQPVCYSVHLTDKILCVVACTWMWLLFTLKKYRLQESYKYTYVHVRICDVYFKRSKPYIRRILMFLMKYRTDRYFFF
jgi:hypothetical protein